MTSSIDRLLSVMSRLRDPDGGCPWDLKQDFSSLAPYTLEEAYEVVEAIENGDPKALRDELGDLLLQIAFHSQLAREKGLFDFDQVAAGIADKMVERHPHVFGDREADTANDVLRNWEADKAKKREAENKNASALDGVNTALPASSRALKLQQRAARVGFDWSNPADIIAKIREETDELETEIVAVTDKHDNKDKMEAELGDLFFVLVNLARHLEIDPESAMRRTNRKFERRFRFIESSLTAAGRSISEATLDEMEQLWNKAKSEEV